VGSTGRQSSTIWEKMLPECWKFCLCTNCFRSHFQLPGNKKPGSAVRKFIVGAKQQNAARYIVPELRIGPEYLLADDFQTWKEYFLQANENADLIYMPTNGAIKNWDDEEAQKLVEENLKIPAITCDDFMMPYVVFGLTKVAKEQGEWAAETALEILYGKKPSEIPYTKNTQTTAFINATLAGKVDFRLSNEMKKKVENIKNIQQ
jgi:hypothetical protein